MAAPQKMKSNRGEHDTNTHIKTKTGEGFLWNYMCSSILWWHCLSAAVTAWSRKWLGNVEACDAAADLRSGSTRLPACSAGLGSASHGQVSPWPFPTDPTGRSWRSPDLQKQERSSFNWSCTLNSCSFFFKHYIKYFLEVCTIGYLNENNSSKVIAFHASHS